MGSMVGPVIMGPDTGHLDYGSTEGFKVLQDQIKDVIKTTTGFEYKHVLITAGATHAINCVFRYSKEEGYGWVGMNKYGYPLYDNMVKYSNLMRVKNGPLMSDMEKNDKIFYLIDSPGNPMGNQSTKDSGIVYWDAVYHSKIYNADLNKYPKHDAMIGSTSKLLGIPGARIGWFATNSDNLYGEVSTVLRADTVTISQPSQLLVMNILSTIDLDQFIRRGHYALADNKEDMQEIMHLFDGQEIPNVGMFWCVKPDSKALDILKNAGVIYTQLDHETIRISLGQTRKVTQEAIQSILKEDRV